MGRDPCDELDLMGAIWKFDKNRLNQTLTDGEKYSTGVRSVVGITWNNEINHEELKEYESKILGACLRK